MHRIVLIAAAALIAAPSTPRAGERPRYPFRSAVITYRISGSIQEGRQVVTIDDHGRKTRTDRETTLSLMGRKQKESIVEIDDGESLYRIDLLKKTGEKTVSPSKIAGEMVRSMSPAQKKALEDVGREFVKGQTASGALKQAGKGTVLGRECAIYEAMGMKTWLWNGVPLRKESPSLGNMVQEAVEIRVDEPVPADRFTPPAGIAISTSVRDAGEAEPVR